MPSLEEISTKMQCLNEEQFTKEFLAITKDTYLTEAFRRNIATSIIEHNRHVATVRAYLRSVTSNIPINIDQTVIIDGGLEFRQGRSVQDFVTNCVFKANDPDEKRTCVLTLTYQADMTEVNRISRSYSQVHGYTASSSFLGAALLTALVGVEKAPPIRNSKKKKHTLPTDWEMDYVVDFSPINGREHLQTI